MFRQGAAAVFLVALGMQRAQAEALVKRFNQHDLEGFYTASGKHDRDWWAQLPIEIVQATGLRAFVGCSAQSNQPPGNAHGQAG